MDLHDQGGAPVLQVLQDHQPPQWAGPVESGHGEGLGDVEDVLSQAWTTLARPGAVVVELSPEQADAAALMARAMGYCDVRVEMDLARRPRALVGRTR